jgi:hypothetical protein
MKFPVCNGNLLMGERLTLQIDGYHKIRAPGLKKTSRITSLKRHVLPLIGGAGTTPRFSQGPGNADP